MVMGKCYISYRGIFENLIYRFVLDENFVSLSVVGLLDLPWCHTYKTQNDRHNVHFAC